MRNRKEIPEATFGLRDRRLKRKRRLMTSLLSITLTLNRLPSHPYYPPVAADTFRCFHLAPGKHVDPLEGSLLTLPLDEHIRYEAISYRWGKKISTTRIICDGYHIKVTQPVADVLQRLRLPGASRLIWLDSICINQSSHEEISSQVTHMDWIYKNATRTILWFGEEDNTTARAFSLLRDLQNVPAKFKREHGSTARPTITDLMYYGMPSPFDDRWLALGSLLDNEWFSRTWVLQEVALAKDPWIQQGSYSFGWHDLEWMTWVLAESGASHQLDLSITRALMVAHIHIQSTSSQGSDILNLLFLSRLTATTKAKDKIFALVGIARDKEDVLKMLDYRCSAAETYAQIAGFYLLRGCLDVLNFSCDPSLRRLAGMPSWVPDWSSDAPRVDLIGHLGRIGGLSPNFVSRRPRKLPRLLADGRTLVVSGAVIDRVADCGKHISPLNHEIHALDTKAAGLWLEKWRKKARYSCSGLSGDDINETFSRTLVLGCCEDAGEETRFFDLYSNWIASLLGYLQYSNCDPSLRSAAVRKYAEKAKAACRERSFFITEKGYMGLGPYFVRPGDFLVYFDGGATLYIIRSSRKRYYTLVGDAYIHGLMDLDGAGMALEDIYLS